MTTWLLVVGVVVLAIAAAAALVRWATAEPSHVDVDVRPGDPWPFGATSAMCASFAPGAGYACSRDPGHRGLHAAEVGLGSRDGSFVVAVWPPVQILDHDEAARRLGW